MTYVFKMAGNSFTKDGRSAEDIINESILVKKNSNNNSPKLKFANYASSSVFGSANSIAYTSAGFYNPIHTPVNWQIPTKRREVYMWLIDSKGLMLQEDLTYVPISEFKFTPTAITQDTLTNGIVYENIISSNIHGGVGELRKPINYFERECSDKRFIKLKTFGYYNDLSVSEEHNVYVIKGKKLKDTVKKYEQKLYREGSRGNTGKKEFINNSKWKIERIKAEEVELKDFLLTPVPKFLESKYVDFDNDFMWAVGLEIADGTLCEHGNFGYIHYNCGTDRPNIITNIENILNQRYSSCKNKEHSNSVNCRRIYSEDKRSYDEFSIFIKGKLDNKKFTKEILHLTKEQMLHILGGYFDGDGSFNGQSKLIANNVSKDMADQLYFMLLMCGINCSLNKYPHYNDYVDTDQEKTYKHSSEWIYRIFVPASEVYKLKPYMRSSKIDENFNYESNGDRVLKFFTKDEDGNKYFAQQICEITEYLYNGIGYDIQIDPERSYVCSGFKVSNCRFFAQNDPTIASSLRFYAQFPFHGFENVINHAHRKEHFDKLKKRLRLEYHLPLIAYEYFALGDAFVMISIQCPKCHGFGIMSDGNVCNHEGGQIGNISIMNPDWIDVQVNKLNPSEPIISFIPDDEMKQIVWSKKPVELYNKIPDHMKKLILSQKPIPLSNRTITHMKHDEIPYNAYGRSIIAPLFPTLAYQDKLRQAQWIVADRHILPIKICKIGSDLKPAGPEDIADTQRQLAMTANDPNLTLVTHNNFDFQWVGSCYTENVEVLTHRGFLKYYDVTEDDLIATYNQETKNMEYHKYINKFEYDYDYKTYGSIHKYKSKFVDIEVTNNHKMFSDTGEWSPFENKYIYGNNYNLIESKNINKTNKFKFLNTINFEGDIPDSFDFESISILKDKNLKLWLSFIGWYLSEGETQRSNGKELKSITGISISQNLNSKYYKHLEDVMNNLFNNYRIKIDDRRDKKRKNTNINFIIDNSEFGRFVASNFGFVCADKKIPIWMKNLPKKYLETLLRSLMMGDRDIKYTKNKVANNRYSTTSKQLADDIQEILFKLGYFPTISKELRKNDKHNDIYRILWSDNSKEKNGNDLQINRNRKKIDYKGKVWCFEVPNHIFIVRLNGKLGIHGNSGKVLQLTKEYELIDKALIKGLGVNEALLSGEGPSYSQAAIGIEATIKRLSTVQNMLAEWITEKVYRLEAQMRGFYKKDLKGNQILDYPEITWSDLNLRDESQKNQLYMQLWEKRLVSSQFILEKLGINYDVETERVRLETGYQQQNGIAPSDGSDKPFGGGGGLGGGLGGGFGGGKGGGMGKTPGGGGAPGLPGDGLAPSMSGGMPSPAGGSAAPSGGPSMASYESQLKNYNQAKNIAPNVHRPNKYKLNEPKSPKIETPKQVSPEDGLYYGPRDGAIRLTELEMKLYLKIEEAQKTNNLPMDFVWQQKPEPEHMPRVVVDGFFPTIKLIVEADGKQWHSSDEDMAKDKNRDDRLRSLGWTVLRFTEDEIKYSLEDVVATIIETAKDLEKANKVPKMKTIASTDNIKTAEIMIDEIVLEDFDNNDEDYENLINQKEELFNLLDK
jgi:very-short-patch-repair endonuclease